VESRAVPSPSACTPAHWAGEQVAVFVPCYCDLLAPQAGIASVVLFERLGIPVTYPEAQTCCGQPVFNAGYHEDARRIAQRFCAIFAPYPWIVTPSGSCATMVRVFFPLLCNDPTVGAVAARVYDLATFLVRILGRTDVGAHYAGRAVYHEGCHARRELGSLPYSLALLRAVRGLELIEPETVRDGAECCGFGGLFSVAYPALSSSMADALLCSLTATGADLVVSGDASCLLHLAGRARRTLAGAGPRFVHLAEVLAGDDAGL
jgi:L-lactate dehydrogenase complex protein LldE